MHHIRSEFHLKVLHIILSLSWAYHAIFHRYLLKQSIPNLLPPAYVSKFGSYENTCFSFGEIQPAKPSVIQYLPSTIDSHR
jgi:hypothetical protein